MRVGGPNNPAKNKPSKATARAFLSDAWRSTHDTSGLIGGKSLTTFQSSARREPQCTKGKSWGIGLKLNPSCLRVETVVLDKLTQRLHAALVTHVD